MKTLEQLRKEIDTIDNQLLELFSKRGIVVKQIGQYKKEHNLPIIDTKREEEKLAVLGEKGKKVGVSEALISQIWKILYNDAYTKEI